MFLRAIIKGLIFSILLLTLIDTSFGFQSKDPCLGSLPVSLEKIIFEKNPGMEVVTPKILNPDHRKLFLKDNKGKCPGIAKVNLYGNDSVVYAVILTKRSKNTYISKLIIGQQLDNGQWGISTLNDNTTGPPPVVEADSPGEYEHVYRDQALKAQHEVLVYIGYESWAVVYAWNGKEIEKVQISD